MSRGDVGKLTVTVEAQTAPFERSLKRASSTTRKFSKDISESADKGLAKLSRQLDVAEKKVKKLETRLKSARAARRTPIPKSPFGLEGIGAGVAGGLGFAGAAGVSRAGAALASFTADSVKSAIELETLQRQFGTLVGDMERGEAIVQRVLDFSADNPLTDKEALGAASFLVGNIEAEKLTDTLRQLGDVAKGTNSNIEDLAAIYVRVKVQGRLTGEELNRLTDRRISLYEALANQIGVTEGEVKKSIADGKVGFQEFEKAFASLTEEGGRFFKSLENSADSTAGKLSKVDSQIEKLKRRFGEAIKESEAFAGALEQIDKTTEDLGKTPTPQVAGAALAASGGVFVQPVVSAATVPAATQAFAENAMIGLADVQRNLRRQLGLDTSKLDRRIKSLRAVQANRRLGVSSDILTPIDSKSTREIARRAAAAERDAATPFTPFTRRLSPVTPSGDRLQDRVEMLGNADSELFSAMMRNAERTENSLPVAAEAMSRTAEILADQQTDPFRNVALSITNALSPLLARAQNEDNSALVAEIRELVNQMRSFITNAPRPAEFF